MIAKKIIILFCLLFISCDTDIPSLPVLDYYCPIENISVEMLDSQSFQLSWEYPPSNSSICGENIGNNFQILYINECIVGSSTLSFNSYEVLPVDVSLYSDPLNYFIEDNRYYFNTPSIQSSSIDDYSFIIKVLYGNNQSLESESVCNSLNFQAPQIINSNTNCISSNECFVELAPISNINYFGNDNISIMRNISTADGIEIEEVEIAVINSDNINQNYIDYIYLDKSCDPKNNQNIPIPLPYGYCRFSTDDTNYIIKYRYEQGDVDSEFSSIRTFNFQRPELDIENKAYSSEHTRIYLNNDTGNNFFNNNENSLVYYHTLKAWTSNNTDYSNPNIVINLADYLDKIFEEQIGSNSFKERMIIDYPISLDDSYFILLEGDNEYAYKNSIDFTLLDEELIGFVLIENNYKSDVNYGNDFYMSVYEVTENDFTNATWSQIEGDLPMQTGFDQSKNFIEQTLQNGFFASLNLDFALPTYKEWEYAAGYDIFNDIQYDYPWGNENPNPASCNFMNSDEEDLDPGTNGIVGVGGHIDYSSVFNIHDMSGNVMEWVNESENADGLRTAKGGNYLSLSEDLLIEKNFYFDEDFILGMGFRVIIK